MSHGLVFTLCVCAHKSETYTTHVSSNICLAWNGMLEFLLQIYLFSKKFFLLKKFLKKFLCLFWLHHVSCRIIVPWPGIEPRATAAKVPSPNHWTTKDIPPKCISKNLFFRDIGRSRDFPGSPVVKTLRFHCRGARVRSLLRELSHKPCGAAKR